MATEKKRRSFTRTLWKLVMIVPSIMGSISNIVSLVEIEARLAGQSIVKLVVLGFLMGTILLSTWLCVLFLLGIYLQSLLQSWPLALLIVLALNLFLLILFSFMIARVKRNLFFPTTRQLLHRMRRLEG